MWETLQEKIGLTLTDIWQAIGDWFSAHLLNILIILVGAYLLRAFGRTVIGGVLRRTLRHDLYPTELDRKKRLQTLDSLVAATLRFGVWIVAGIMIINELGVNTAPLLASAGIIGIVVGVGAQSIIKDFISGVFIITENQYRVGDVIELNTVSGVVEAITIRTTTLRDLDGSLHHVPNGTITLTTNRTMNYASINVDVIVDTNTDIAKLEHVINHVGEQMAGSPEFKSAIKEPPYFERVDNLTADGIVVKILGKTSPGDQWKVKGEFLKRLKAAFDKHDIVLSTKQVTLHQAKRTHKS